MANHRLLIRDRLARAMTDPGEAFVGFIDTAQDVFRELSNADAETVDPYFLETTLAVPSTCVDSATILRQKSQCIIPCCNASCNDKRERP